MFQTQWIHSYLTIGGFEHFLWTSTTNKLLGNKNYYSISQTSRFRFRKKGTKTNYLLASNVFGACFQTGGDWEGEWKPKTIMKAGRKFHYKLLEIQGRGAIKWARALFLTGVKNYCSSQESHVVFWQKILRRMLNISSECCVWISEIYPVQSIR